MPKLPRYLFMALVSVAVAIMSARATEAESPAPAAAKVPPASQILRGLVYGSQNGVELKLDLHLPSETSTNPVPLLVWIHGGGFAEGGRGFCPLAPLANDGYAVASISYRLSGQAVFPAPIEDCKAAVRWLRAHAVEYNIAPDRIGVCGESAGGLLAALLGTAPEVPAWGDTASAGVPSRVQAVVALCGMFDLTLEDTEQAQVPELLKSGDPARIALGKTIASRMKLLSAALGGPPDEHREMRREMSPLLHVTADDPPFLLVHGDSDRLIPLSQSVALQEALVRAGVKVELVVVPGAGHGFGRPKPELMARIKAFFDARL